MQLDYIWVKDHKNIQNQEFNFGSDYTYSLKPEDDKLILSRSRNNSYIENLFKIEGRGFENVTALVGENASGKSNTLNLIRGILKNSFNVFGYGEEKSWLEEYIAVYSYRNSKGILKTCIDVQTDEAMFDADFKWERFHDFEFEKECIFYSPVYDFSIYPIKHSNPRDIDVSSNFLLYKDYEVQEFAFGKLDQAEYHKFQNVARQIDFVQQFGKDSEFLSVINIPTRCDIIIQENDVTREKVDSFGFHNTPYTFRPYFNLLLNKYRKELDILADEGYLTRTDLKDKARLKEIKFQQYFLFFLWYLLRNLLSNIERSNHYLNHGEVTIEEEGLSILSFEEAFIEFLDNQNLFDAESIKNLIYTMKAVNQQSHVIDIDSTSSKSLSSPLGLAESLRAAYIDYLIHLSPISGDRNPYEFISFDWSGLSTGEKAFLDLFSRIYYGKKLIQERVEDENRRQIKSLFPEFVYILLDEAEIGFHPQWQKEFIYKLVHALPLIFGNNVKLQLLFTTHSPMSLSDIPQYNVIFMKKNKRATRVLSHTARPRHSFGANIHEMLYDAFYLENGFIGHFAQHKIQKAIDWCLEPQGTDRNPVIEKIINIIDDPIVKVKLTEMYANKIGLNVEVERLKAQRAFIQSRLNDLENQ